MKTNSDADLTIPLRPQATTEKILSKDNAVSLLRGFYLGDSELSLSQESVHGQYLPAFLGAYRDGSTLRHDYPLFIASPIDAPSSNDQLAAKWPSVDFRDEKDNMGNIGIFPLPGLFKNLMADSEARINQKRLLEENLVWLEKHVIEIVAKSDGIPEDANTVLNRAASALQSSLRLGEKQYQQLDAGLAELMERMPAGYFLAFHRHVPLHILAHMHGLRFRSQYQKTLREARNLATRLGALLEVEKNKSIESIEPKMVLDSIGPAGSRFMDPHALSDLMDHSHGSRDMASERLQRVRETLEILEDEGIAGMGSSRLTLIRNVATDGVWGLSGAVLPPGLSTKWELRAVSDPFATALAIFDEQAAMLIRLARAMRIASLELDNAYDAKIHDPWFENFDWRSLSEEESKLAPVVVVIDSASNVVRNGLIGLSRLLRSDRPVQVLLEVDPGADPGGEENPEADSRTENNHTASSNDSRMELGYLGINYRRATVTQSSTARPLHLMDSFVMALQRDRPALHMLGIAHSVREEIEQPLSPWLVESAAVEGRAHPLFRYDPEIGGKWWVPLSLTGNPEPEIDWPLYPLEYRTEDGEITKTEMTFGFVDYALLNPRWWRYFYPIPDTLDTKEIIHVDDYLALEVEQMKHRLPFLWAVYDNQRAGGTKLRRLLVSQPLILACLDRREFWRTLQALSGVHNRHVEIAVDRVNAEAEEKAQREQTRLMEEHRAELARARQEAGAEALRRLTETLLATDLLSTPLASDADPITTPPPSFVLDETPTEVQDEGPQEVDIAPESERHPMADPWIDTPLCTSCNECTDLNPKLFVYNDDKQAEIGDLAAGTHAELLEAAEMCPAQCIYPGISK
uniref:Ferredoxin n=1 Tax=Candidatus Kentrum sp. SD TaxID=2126332 RepID=A0A450YDV2_9GAMM|nr:MAG: Ferredoxin [Candidatus Kentron sp. SD]VFK47304.1 MAG: Ferredoxin [Candidatus Kentron sp. SD]